jgi:hypothetical protein
LRHPASAPFFIAFDLLGCDRPGLAMSCSSSCGDLWLLTRRYLTGVRVPPLFWRLFCYGTYWFWFIAGLLVLRKTENAIAAVKYVKMHGSEVSAEALERAPAFRELLNTLDEFKQPPAICMFIYFRNN